MGDCQALDCGEQFCLAGQERATMEELQEKTRDQPAVSPLGIPGFADQQIVNTLLIKQASICHVRRI